MSITHQNNILGSINRNKEADLVVLIAGYIYNHFHLLYFLQRIGVASGSVCSEISFHYSAHLASYATTCVDWNWEGLVM